VVHRVARELLVVCVPVFPRTRGVCHPRFTCYADGREVWCRRLPVYRPTKRCGPARDGARHAGAGSRGSA